MIISEQEKNRIRKLHECGVCDGMAGTDGISIEMGEPESEDMDIMVIDTPETPEYEEEMSIDARIAEIQRHLAAIRATE
tara:strand:+ start:4354 stop:4590 length:237 start_codon:yes stop_codon:yes gene_type:complete